MAELRQRRTRAEHGAIDVDLARRVVDVVIAAQHMRDRHVDVVDDDGEVVGRHPVAACDHEIVELGVGERDRTLDQVVPADVAVIRIAEAHDGLHSCRRRHATRVLRAPAAVVARLLAARHLCLAQLLEFFLARVAAIGLAVGQQPLDHVAVAVETVGLPHRSLVVVEVEPAHAVENDLDGLLGRTLEVGVLDAQDELAAVMARERPAEQRRAGGAQVQHAGRAGSDAGADGTSSGETGVRRRTPLARGRAV